MAEVSEKRKQYIEDWQKENIQRVVVKFNRKSERDQSILDHLKTQEECSVQEYIKRAVEEKMNK